MFSKNPKNKIETLTKQIPSLAKLPEAQRLIVFKQAFKSTGYKIFLTLVFISFILVFYFNIDAILTYKGLERGGMIARSTHFLKELGANFFLPLMVVMLALVLGRNYFVQLEVKKVLAKNEK